MFSLQLGMFPTWTGCESQNNKSWENCNGTDYDTCKKRALSDCQENSCYHFAVGTTETVRISYGYYTYDDLDCIETNLARSNHWDFYTRIQSKVLLLFVHHYISQTKSKKISPSQFCQ